jgi:hypothetical protein
MNTITETKQYYLTSNSNKASLVNGTNKSHIIFYLPKMISTAKNILYHSVKISHLEIPYSFYNINEANNLLVFNGFYLEIPTANYNAITLQDTINQILSDNSIDASFSFDNRTGRFNVVSSNLFSIGNTSTICKSLGLQDGSNYVGIFDFVNSQYYLEAPFLANLSGTNNIFIKTNLITNNYNTFNDDITILKSIPVNVSPFSIIMYNNTENIETIVKNRDLNYLEVELVDDIGNLVNFNNIDWNICLEIKSVHQLQQYNFNLDDYFTQQSDNQNIEEQNNEEQNI